jgi:hypothetical protein
MEYVIALNTIAPLKPHRSHDLLSAQHIGCWDWELFQTQKLSHSFFCIFFTLMQHWSVFIRDIAVWNY